MMSKAILKKTLEIFPWNNNFAVGIPEIDAQHRKLVQLLNGMASDLIYKSDEISLNTLFNDLSEYAVYHFHTEENVWHQYLAGDRVESAHRGAHESFVADLVKLKQENGAKPFEDLLEDILVFLTHWLAYHILEDDKYMAMVIRAMQSGLSVEQAKQKVKEELRGATGVLVKTVLSMYDTVATRTLQLMKIEREALALMQRNKTLMQSTPEGIHILDNQGKIVEFNEAFRHHLGYTHEELLQLSLYDFEAKLTPDEIRANLIDLLTSNAQFETVHRRKDGKLVDVEVVLSGVELEYGKCFFCLSRDITERKLLEEKIQRLAYFDTLTGLPNRRMLNDRLSHALALGKRTNHYGALMFIDLDNFKPLNDSHGHGVGDLLLMEVANRLSGVVREMDTIARFGGDEFVVILGELEEDKAKAIQHATMVAEKILADLCSPYEMTVPDGIGNKQITHRCSASIGVAMFVNEENAEEVLHRSDIAMYQAKEAGRNRIRLFDMLN